MTKKGNIYVIFSHYFSRFYQMKTRPYTKNLRPSSLIKVKIAIFEFTAWSHVRTCIYFYNIYINV